MPIVQGIGNAGYTPLTTAGTYTLNPGPGTPGVGVTAAGSPGALYGVYVTTFGTSPVFSAYELKVGATSTTTSILMNGTATAVNQSFTPLTGAAVPGIRYTGGLIIVVTGTANGMNVLWD